MPNLKLRISGITCLPPILESVTMPTERVFDLVWNYDGIDYSYDDTTAILFYYSTDGISYNLVTPSSDYPSTNRTIDLTSVVSEVFHFKLQLQNRTCDRESNVITYTL